MKMKTTLTYLVSLLLAALCPMWVQAQQVAVKNNLVYDALLTPNLGLELQTGERSTLQAFYGINAWDSTYGKELKHWVAQPEWRYWFCQAFSGWFVGVHAMGGEFNVSDVKFPLGLTDVFKRGKREEGWYAGGGLSVGYQWMLGRHWNFEASIGAGYDYIHYKRYKCGHCGDFDKRGHDHYIGPTRAALSILYMF